MKMIKRLSVIIVLSFLMVACQDFDRPKKPDNLISKAQMTELLYDLYIINAAKGVNRKTLENNSFNPENYILEKYNIDSTQFAQSNTYYAFETETYSAIVEQVKARLEKEKDIYEAIKQKQDDSIQKRRDSINEKAKRKKDSLKKVLDSIGVKDMRSKPPLNIADSLQELIRP
ncbi:DUF4296 domain-containing protein [Winogradskyella forsetii]|uniref:DUF4296 domain-containing protein n=2 Tax=Winogradskyella forsetii TaxID=2686077 RepID=UPI0015C1BEF9|nr:DUF4296 domain-containing protein [Winogradskyella forsetii]